MPKPAASRRVVRAGRARRRRSARMARGAARLGRRDYPPLVWIAAPDVVAGARLADDGDRARHCGGDLAFRARRRRSRSTARTSTRRRRASSRCGRSRCAERSRRRHRRAHAVARGLSGSPSSRRCAPLSPARPAALALRALVRADPAGRRAQSVRRLDACGGAIGARRRSARSCGARDHGQRRAGRRRRGARRALRARHRPRAGGRRDRRLARQQFLHARHRERKGHPRRARSARQLPRRSQQRTGMVSAVVHARGGALARPRPRAAAVGARSRLQPVLAPPARLLPPDDELHQHQRRRAASLGWDIPPRGPTSRLVRHRRLSLARASRAIGHASDVRRPTICGRSRRACCPPRRSRRSARACSRWRRAPWTRSRAARSNDARRRSRRTRLSAVSAVSVEPRVGRRARRDAARIPAAPAAQSGAI